MDNLNIGVQIPSSDLSTAAKSMLHDFFYNKILALDVKSRTNHRLEKQRQINELRYKIEALIVTNRYSIFEVVVLEPRCDDVVNIDYGVMIKNFRYFVDGQLPNKYRIVISETWNGYTMYQRSIDDKYWNKLPQMT